MIMFCKVVGGIICSSGGR